MAAMRDVLMKNYRLKLFVNNSYVYIIHMVHVILNFMPGFVRNFCFRLMLKKLGSHTYLDYGVYIKFPWLVRIGSQCSINRGTEFYPDFFGRHEIIIGNNVRIAPNVHFYAAGHDISDMNYAHCGDEIVVGDDVWLGAGAMILPGVTIGSGTVIGAGSVVTCDIPERVVAVGNPARAIKSRKECS